MPNLFSKRIAYLLGLWLAQTFIAFSSVPPVHAQAISPQDYEIPLEAIVEPSVAPQAVRDRFDSTITAIDLGQLHYVVRSGDPDEKLDILFIPRRMTDMAQIEASIKNIVGITGSSAAVESFFDEAPFSSYKTEYNFAYVDKNIDEVAFNCYVQPPDPNNPSAILGHGCNTQAVIQGYSQFRPDYIVLLFDLPSGYISSAGEIMNLEYDQSFVQSGQMRHLFKHEFAHQYGGLADEYTLGSGRDSYHCSWWLGVGESCFDKYAESIRPVPNIDTVGCPKWCSQYDLTNLLAENASCAAFTTRDACIDSGSRWCNWLNTPHPFLGTRCVIPQSSQPVGTVCSQNVQCVYGADYGQLAFRPNSMSIMGTGVDEFNIPSQEHLGKALSCCFPRKETAECQALFDNAQLITPGTNYNLGKALTKLSQCGLNIPCEPTMMKILSNFSNPSVCQTFDRNSDAKVSVLDALTFYSEYY
jgi:hypothetical protein